MVVLVQTRPAAQSNSPGSLIQSCFCVTGWRLRSARITDISQLNLLSWFHAKAQTLSQRSAPRTPQSIRLTRITNDSKAENVCRMWERAFTQSTEVWENLYRVNQIKTLFPWPISIAKLYMVLSWLSHNNMCQSPNNIDGQFSYPACWLFMNCGLVPDATNLCWTSCRGVKAVFRA